MTVRLRTTVMVFLVVCAICGCGPSVGTVAGTVKYKGQPIPSGTISFHGSDNRPVSGQITPTGTFSVPEVPSGPVRVTVQTPYEVVEMQKRLSPQLPSDAPQQAMAGRIEAIWIPKKYEDPDQSGLTFDVKRGSNTCRLDLD